MLSIVVAVAGAIHIYLELYAKERVHPRCLSGTAGCGNRGIGHHSNHRLEWENLGNLVKGFEKT